MDRGAWWAAVHGVTKSWYNQSELACTHASLWAFLITHLLKNLPEMWETWIQFLGWEDPLEKGPLRVPWTLRRSDQSILKEISPEYSLEGCWSWNSNTLATWCEELTHWKRPWCWERLKTGGKGDDRGWDGWMASPTWWTWVWANYGSRWWTGKPCVLQSMGSQRIGHDWVTELNWCFIMPTLLLVLSSCAVEHEGWKGFEGSSSPLVGLLLDHLWHGPSVLSLNDTTDRGSQLCKGGCLEVGPVFLIVRSMGSAFLCLCSIFLQQMYPEDPPVLGPTFK